jgi:hypothetical protein
MNMEQPVEWGLAGETEVLGENPSQCRFVRDLAKDITNDRGVILIEYFSKVFNRFV